MVFSTSSEFALYFKIISVLAGNILFEIGMKYCDFFSVLAPELLKDFKNFYLSLIALIFVKQEPSQKAFN